MKKGVNVGTIVKEMSTMVSGGGGGRPNMARGGGTDPSGMDNALARSVELLKEQLK